LTGEVSFPLPFVKSLSFHFSVFSFVFNMKKIAFVVFLFVAVSSCSNEKEASGVLSQAPYAPLTDSIQQQPDNAGLYYRRGAMLYGANQKGLAEADLKKAWQLQPVESHALSMVTVLIDKHPDSAIHFINDALKVLPKSISLHIALARGYQQKGAIDQSIDVCNQILTTHPNALDALLLKAELLKTQDKQAEALATLETAYAYAPFDPQLAYNLAFEYAEAKNNKALSLTDSLLQIPAAQTQAEPYYIKGVYYQNTGNATQAIQFYDRAIQQDYNFLDAYMEKGRLLFDQKKYAAALQTFGLPVTISPTYADAYYWMGRCQEALNAKAEAKQNYQLAYSLDKTLTEAKEAAEKL
jgi:tetratricopeptide (TPR) repeat protein